jgi:hypothetical protein
VARTVFGIGYTVSGTDVLVTGAFVGNEIARTFVAEPSSAALLGGGLAAAAALAGLSAARRRLGSGRRHPQGA